MVQPLAGKVIKANVMPTAELMETDEPLSLSAEVTEDSEDYYKNAQELWPLYDEKG
jgi:hypothetical protein